MKTLLLAIMLLAVGVLLMGVKVFFVKGGRFPSGHAHEVLAKRRRLLDKRRNISNENKQ